MEALGIGSEGVKGDSIRNPTTHLNTHLSSPRSPFSKPPPEPPQQTNRLFPYIGDFSGASFNSQAYFSSNIINQNRRRRFVRGLCQQHDFVGLQETHSTAGRAGASEPFPGIRQFWSHGIRRTQGIALFVKESFLAEFTNIWWEEVEVGQVGALRLQGPRGALDIVVVYLSATDAGARSESIHALASSTRPADKVLSCVFGDFNFTEHSRDRFSKTSGSFTGAHDGSNARDWKSKMGDLLGFHEWEQNEHTHENGLVRSRLDRFYLNQHLTHQIQKHSECVALPFPLGLSDHRPISFARRTPRKDKWSFAMPPLPSGGVEQWFCRHCESNFQRAHARSEVPDRIRHTVRSENISACRSDGTCSSPQKPRGRNDRGETFFCVRFLACRGAV